MVEVYPGDKYLPSYLVLAKSAGEAYRPSEVEWEDDWKTRRVQR